MIASHSRLMTSSIDRMLSSLPGIGRSIKSGSQSVSSRATTLMPSFRASATAMCSRRGSTTKRASGSRFMCRMPLKLRSIFLPLAGQGRDHLLGVGQRLLAVQGILELLEPLEPAADGPKVGEGPSQPPLGHIGHAGASALLDDRLGRLPLGADEQDQAVGRRHAVEKLDRAQQPADRFFQVNNMNQVALAVDVRLHLRVPPAGAVAIVNPCINKIFDDERHSRTSGSLQTNPAAIPRARRGATLLRWKFGPPTRESTLSGRRAGVKPLTIGRTTQTLRPASSGRTCGVRDRKCTCTGRPHPPWRRRRRVSNRRGAFLRS